MNLNVAIIDDEIHAIETLVYDLKEGFDKSIEIVFTSTNPVEGIKRLRSEIPDLLFLDIEMPGLSGLDILSLIDDLNIQVVITTAHQEFAIQTVGTKAIAYLLKPVQPENLEAIINQALVQKKNPVKTSLLKDKIAIPDMEGIELIQYSEIMYCKSDGNYSTLALIGNRKMTVSKPLKYFEENISSELFLRIHKSYLVNLTHVKKYLKKDGGELVMTNNDVLPVSRNSRNELLKFIQNSI
ncbi:MAG: response regulator transcription factor [Bacteroidales bacterium]|nr:response regulator transcription factor [Bacteroidales bacterium]